MGTWSRPNKDLRAEQDCDKYVKSEPEFAIQNLQSIKNVATKMNFKALQEIVDLCRKNNINLIVFTTPHNHNYLDSVYENEYYLFLKELVKITDYWDFSGYNSITTNDCNYYENSHYRSKIGNLIMAKIFNDKNISIPADFGVKLTKENIEAHLTKLKTESEIWRKTPSKRYSRDRSFENKSINLVFLAFRSVDEVKLSPQVFRISN